MMHICFASLCRSTNFLNDPCSRIWLAGEPL